MTFAGIGMLICAAIMAVSYYREDRRAAESSAQLLQELRAQIETETGTAAEESQEHPLPEVIHHEADITDTDGNAGDAEDAEQRAKDAERRVEDAEQRAEDAERRAEDAELPADLPEHALGILELPAWELALPVMDAYSEELLRQYPCSYGAEECGDGQVIIAGHNYKSHFRCLSAMQAGNAVVLTTADGVRHTYEVSEIIEISGNDREALFAGTWDLTLFTCAGYRRNRVVVRCRLQDDLTEV